MPPFAVNIVALVSFASSWSIGHGLSSLLTPAKKTVNSAFDDLLPVFEKDDDGSDLYDAIHQNYVIETPTEEDITNIVKSIIEGKESSYFIDNDFTSHDNQTGIARQGNGFTMNVSSYIYGKFTGSTDRRHYTSIAINLDEFGFGGVNAPVGNLFYSEMGFSVEGNKLNWQGITKGSIFMVGKGSKFGLGANETSVIMDSFEGVTKGLTEYLGENEIKISVNTLGVNKNSKGFNKHNSTYLGILEIGELPFQSIKLDLSYLSIGLNGTYFLNSSYQEDGSVDYSGEGNIFRYDRNFTQNLNFTGNSQLALDNPYSEDILQHFFNLIYFGKGLFVP